VSDPTPEDRDRHSVRVDERRSAAPPDEGLPARAAGVLRRPAATFRSIAHDEPVGQAFAVVVIVTVLLTVVQGFGILADPGATVQTALVTLVTGMVIGVPMGVVFFLLWVGAVLLGAKLFGGTATFPATLAGLGFAYAPLALGGIVAGAALPSGAAAAAIVVLAFLAATLWSFVLDVIAIREIHQMSTGRAVGAVVLPVVALGALAVLLFGALLAALVTAM
jgi:hypothetical protein